MTDASTENMVCIYCRQPSDSAKSDAHIFPEAVIANQSVLPRGMVCDECNNYLGKLDQCFVSHPWIALAVQFMGLPGKDGRPRKQLGGVSRVEHPGWVTFEVQEPTFQTDSSGVRSGEMRPLIDARFDFAQFRRSLHHIALNVVAGIGGQEVALDPALDAVRSYVRKPRNRQHAWPFAQHFGGSAVISPRITLRAELIGGLHIVTVGFANITFWVDLYGTDALRQVTPRHLPPGTDYIPADYRPARPPKPGKKRYRASIELPPKRGNSP